MLCHWRQDEEIDMINRALSLRMSALLRAIGVLLALSFGAAQADEKAIKIGVLTDINGPYADLSGMGSVEAVRLAVEEVGGVVLGHKVEVLFADHQNKADIGAAIAAKWFDVDDVDVIADFSNSSVGFAVQTLANSRNRIILLSAGSSDFTGKLCSPITSQWVYNGYTNGYVLARELTRQGLKSWYIIAADYAFGHSFETEIRKAVADNGGIVLGSARHPINTSDFASYLLAAQASGAQVIAFANAGADTINAVKQAKEFNISPKQTIATPALFNTDIKSLGLNTSAGLKLITSAYIDFDERTKKWAQLFFERRKIMPSMAHVGMYSATQHYLKSVAAANTTDGRVVAAKMKELPVDNAFTRNGVLRTDGQMVHDLFLAEVKSPTESNGDWDQIKILSVIPPDQAFRPLTESECPLVKRVESAK
jgi:branched-chain amino acid transport system substrate-binding protein